MNWSDFDSKYYYIDKNRGGLEMILEMKITVLYIFSYKQNNSIIKAYIGANLPL